MVFSWLVASVFFMYVVYLNIPQLGFLRNINKLWIKLTGSAAEFPLEFRIFHSLCLIVILALAYNIPFNYFIGLPLIALACVVIMLVFIGLYYRSRYLGKVQSSIVIFAIGGSLLFTLNFFYNSGTQGPTDLFMGLCILVLLCMAPSTQQRLWVGMNIFIIITLHLIEYNFPALVPNTYVSREARYWDLSSAYVVIVAVLYFTVTYLKKNYEVEKRSAAHKADAIEQQNKHILKQNNELERINSERNKLMSIMAHDLRSPLSNIQNYLELVTEYELDTEERQMVEGDLLKVTRSTIEMLSKLLVWSKAQMDGVNVKLTYITLRDALYNTIELEKAIALKKGIALQPDLQWDIKIVADNDMLQLIIRNLISNAIKFTPAGGQISFKAKKIGTECWLIIRDTGIGISDEKKAELFSLRAESTFGTDNEKGVGLGLMLCKEFTELQGGRIWLESPQGGGTVFYVSMPAVG